MNLRQARTGPFVAGWLGLLLLLCSGVAPVLRHSGWRPPAWEEVSQLPTEGFGLYFGVQQVGSIGILTAEDELDQFSGLPPLSAIVDAYHARIRAASGKGWCWIHLAAVATSALMCVVNLVSPRTGLVPAACAIGSAGSFVSHYQLTSSVHGLKMDTFAIEESVGFIMVRSDMPLEGPVLDFWSPLLLLGGVTLLLYFWAQTKSSPSQ